MKLSGAANKRHKRKCRRKNVLFSYSLLLLGLTRLLLSFAFGFNPTLILWVSLALGSYSWSLGAGSWNRGKLSSTSVEALAPVRSKVIEKLPKENKEPGSQGVARAAREDSNSLRNLGSDCCYLCIRSLASFILFCIIMCCLSIISDLIVAYSKESLDYCALYKLRRHFCYFILSEHRHAGSVALFAEMIAFTCSGEYSERLIELIDIYLYWIYIVS